MGVVHGGRQMVIPALLSVRTQTPRSAGGLLNKLIAYWALDEAAGANDALDKHSNGLTLTQVSSPGSAAGKVYAGARTFDGAADYFSRASEPLLQTGDVDFTVVAWVYMSSATSARDIVNHYRTGDNERAWLMRYEGTVNRFNAFVSSDGTYKAGVTGTELRANTFGAASINTWYMVAFWHDSGNNTINISINNGVVDSAAWTAGIHVSSAAFGVGRYDSGANFFAGRIGPVAMWKSAAGAGGCLSSSQRNALWNGGLGLAYSAFTT